MVGSARNGICTDKDISGSVGITIITSSKHVHVDLTGTDVDHAVGVGFGSIITSEFQGIVGVTRTAIDGTMDAAAKDVDSLKTGMEHTLILGTLGATKHIATDATTSHSDKGAAG